MLSEIFNPLSIVLHVANALILFVAIRLLLYKPIQKFLKKREDAIAASLQNAEEDRASAQKLLEQSKTQMNNAMDKANETISKSAQRGREMARQIIDDASDQASTIVKKAGEDAERIRESAKTGMEEETSRLAIAIASKVLSREVSEADNKKIIEEFLEKVD